MQAFSKSLRIVLIGKSVSGKSSLANAIFGKPIFKVNHSSDSKKRFSESYMKKVTEQEPTFIDTAEVLKKQNRSETSLLFDMVYIVLKPPRLFVAVPPPAVPPPAVPPPAVPPPPVPLPPVKEPTPPEDVVEGLQEVVQPINTVLDSALESLEDLFD